MLGGFHDGRSPSEFASGIEKLSWIEQRLASIALISPSVFVTAFGTCADDEAISQELPERLRKELLHFVLHQLLLFVEGLEDGLADGGLMPSGSATEFVAADLEPVVDLFVNRMVFVADLLTADALFVGLDWSDV